MLFVSALGHVLLLSFPRRWFNTALRWYCFNNSPITNRRHVGQNQAARSFHLVLRLSRAGLLFSLYFYRASTSILVKVPFSLTYILPKLLKLWLERTTYINKKGEKKHVNFSDTVWTECHFIEIEERVCASFTKEKPHEAQNIYHIICFNTTIQTKLNSKYFVKYNETKSGPKLTIIIVKRLILNE